MKKYNYQCEDHIIDIVSGIKLWEERRNVGKWKQIKQGDTLVLHGRGYHVTTIVT
jgi:hypothetical protein